MDNQEPKSGGFTAGPWEVRFGRWTEDAPVRGFAIRAHGKAHSIAGNNVAERVNNEEYAPAELEANARLIAASPDLLEALTAAEEALQYAFRRTRDQEDADHFERVRDQARAAIQKATQNV